MTEASDPTSATRASIFLRLRNDDRHPREMAWREFAARYSHVIRGFARDLGAKPHEIDEVVQHVLVSFFKRSPTFVYDPQLGSFRGYLKVATLNCIRKQYAAKKFNAVVELEQLPDDSEQLSGIW